MKASWKKVSLESIYTFKSGLSKPRSEFGFGHTFISFKDVFYNFFLPAQPDELVNSNEREQSVCSVLKGDVFLTRTSETFNELGMSSVALKDYPNATFNGFTKRLRPINHSAVLPEYAGYYFRSSYFRNLMTSFTTMSTRASLNNEILSKLHILLPPIAEQEVIGHHLKVLDDKIDLLRQQNATLEAMAQTLFRSWFVDFDPVIDNALDAGHPLPDALAARVAKRKRVRAHDHYPRLPEAVRRLFPDRFVFSEELGKWVPAGWKSKKVSDSIIRLKVPTRYSKSEINTYGTFPVLEQGADIVMGYLDSDPDFLASKDEPICVFGDHTCILELSTVSFSLSSNIIPFQGKKIPTYWLYHALNGKQKFEEYRRHWKELIFKDLLVPSIDLMQNFSNLVDENYTSIDYNRNRIQTVRLLRDTLLPELISGKLSVENLSNAKKMVLDK